jgi:hypothetical protein
MTLRWCRVDQGVLAQRRIQVADQPLVPEEVEDHRPGQLSRAGRGEQVRQGHRIRRRAQDGRHQAGGGP